MADGRRAASGDRTAEQLDVLIVGAGLSGIGAAYHLQASHPQRTYAILEAREAIGGTWDLFRYPGVRSDSDMHTLGYSFRPWQEAKAIADGHSILRYVCDTARESGIDKRVRFGHRVMRAEFSSAEACWTVETQRTDTGEIIHFSANFLLICTGYYRYDAGYSPAFAGMDRFQGRVVHPQHWPGDLDYRGKRVIVIGSGATAVTLVPAMAPEAAQVTMLQRSPSYIVAIPGEDPAANLLRRLLSPARAYSIVRWKNVLLMTVLFQLSRRRPEWIKRVIRKAAQLQLPPGYDVDPHFKPQYNPWDQRMCFVPDGDLFRAIRDGDASIVTGQVETVTERGLRLTSGAELEADVIVTATGLSLLALGGIRLVVDGREVELSQTMAYKGTMLSGVPNLALAVGYTNASWTLKCDLTSQYVCRLLRHMDEHGYTVCTPVNRDPSIRELPLIDLSSGYVQRSVHLFPKQGSSVPWRLYQNYALDRILLRRRPVNDGALEFKTPPRPAAEPDRARAAWADATAA